MRAKLSHPLILGLSGGVCMGYLQKGEGSLSSHCSGRVFRDRPGSASPGETCDCVWARGAGEPFQACRRNPEAGGSLPEATPLLSANPGQCTTIGSRGTIW